MRQLKREVKIGNVTIGGKNPVAVQTMLNVPVEDIEGNVAQAKRCEAAGCQILRVTCPSPADAKCIEAVKNAVNIPIVADIHFDYKAALACADVGVDKIRINPGNIGRRENVEAVVEACRSRHVPIRIGINGGSLEKDIHEKYGRPTAEGMMESARRHVDILESLDFHDIVLSFKSSDPLLCIEAYRMAAERFPYPLHLGVTEAGTLMGSAVKSSMALGTLLNEGIGDTIRISVNGDPCDEIMIARQLLSCCKLIDHVPNLIACPTCGRTAWDMQPIVSEIERFLTTVNKDITVAIMGCVVNGPGEARHADIAIAGGKKEGLLIRKGEIIEKIPQDQIAQRLKQEIMQFQPEK